MATNLKRPGEPNGTAEAVAKVPKIEDAGILKKTGDDQNTTVDLVPTPNHSPCDILVVCSYP